MHAVIRSLTKNYCVFSFIVHSCKLQCLKFSVDECTYAREEREKKSFIYLCTWLCIFSSVQHWTLVHNFLVIFWFQTERESEKNEKDIWAKTDKQAQLKPHDTHNRYFSFFLFSLSSVYWFQVSHIYGTEWLKKDSLMHGSEWMDSSITLPLY